MNKDISRFEGKKAEKIFLETAIREGVNFIRKATKEEDVKEHWDFLLKDYNNVKFLIDVKAHKHEYRNGPLLKDWYWIEWKNVNGDKGWIHGKADYIAFIYFDKIYIYNRCELRDAADDLIDKTKIVKKASLAQNCIYQRFGRKDQLSMIKITSLHSRISPEIIWSILK